MSCDAAAAVFLMFASFGPQEALVVRAADPVPAVNTLKDEPLFADIVQRSAKLLGFTNGYRDLLKEDAESLLPEYAMFTNELKQLADLDFKAHQQLEQRGQDLDLKCILRGISADIHLKMGALEEAKDVKAKDKALRELGYLLRDNVEVITAPPAPPV